VATVQEIRDAATHADEPLPTLLRMCMTLAREGAAAELARWAALELNGYARPGDAPGYRRLPALARGNFSGPYGSGMQDAPIDPSAVPEQHRAALFQIVLVQPIAELSARADTAEAVIEPWPGDLLATYMRDLYLGMNCLAAWREVAAAALVGVLDVVRTQVLTRALLLSPTCG
jgi:hypothetical protein